MQAAQKELERAVDLLSKDRRSAAEVVIRKVLKSQPDNADALHLFGVCHHLAGRKRPAVVWLAKAAAANPNSADIHNRLGLAHQAVGDFDQAMEAYVRAVNLNPRLADAYNNLGGLYFLRGDNTSAIAQYRLALDCDTKFVGALQNLGSAYIRDGQTTEALRSFAAAIELAPQSATAWSGMGSANKDLGNIDEARTCYRKAIEFDATYRGAWFNLHATLYNDDNPELACECLEQALQIDKDDVRINFFLGVARARQGRTAQAQKYFDAVEKAADRESYRLDSWKYVESSCGADTRILGTSAEVLRFAVESAALPGLVLEFGVRHGMSIRLIAAAADQTVHGFDSFDGLPEDWHEERAGTYTTHGKIPTVPKNVLLHQGLFEDSLPDFLNAEPGAVRLMNIDCDLYSSTATVLNLLAPRIVPGTVIVFDEYICHRHWREDEFRAFQEAASTFGWTYDYLAFSLFTKQAAVIIR